MVSSASEPRVSVVVPVYNGRQTIGGAVECLLRQTHPAHEIIIVDDGSVDGTAEVLRPWADRVRVLSKPNGGPASARNLGVRAATGEFIAFTDSDCLPDGEWIASLLRGFDDESVAGVGGTVKGVGAGAISEYVDSIRLLEPVRHGDDGVVYLITCNTCFRRDALLEAGLFDERFRKPGGEEPELCMRLTKLGYQFRAVEDAVILHHHKPTVKDLLKTIANYGEGSYLLQKKWPELKRHGNPYAELLKSLLLPIRYIPGRVRAHARGSGLRRGLLFTFLDHVRPASFTWGYIRGMRNDRRAGQGQPD